MHNLLDLPAELLGRIFEKLIDDYGTQIAVKARLTCKYFDAEIVRAIWTTRALEGRDRPRPTRFIGRTILVSYLLGRTLTDRQRHHYLTAAIYEALEHIQHSLQDFVIDDDAVRMACSAVVDTGKLPDPSYALEPALVDCSPAENALALAAYMRLASAAQALIENGVGSRDTYFGNSLCHVARSWDFAKVSLYFEAKSKAQKCRAWLADAEIGPEISFKQYREAMRLAIHENSPEVLRLIMKTARDDGKLDKQEDGGWLPQLNVRRHGTASIQSYVLLHAVYAGRTDMAKMAIDDGADAKQGVKGSTLLDIAAESGNVEMLALLLEKGADLSFCIRHSPLTTAVLFGREEAVKLCLDYGMTKFSRTSPDAPWAASLHPLVVAGRQRYLHILQLLLNHGITFELGSELDKCLSQGADAEMEKILAAYRANPAPSQPTPELEASDSVSLAVRSWEAALRAADLTPPRSVTTKQATDTTSEASTSMFELPTPILPASISTLQALETPATPSQPISCPNLRDQLIPSSREDDSHRLHVPGNESPRTNRRTAPRGLRRVSSFLSQSAVFRAIRAA